MLPRKAIGFGIVLILVGAFFFFKTGMHFTALIPSLIGFLIAVCGLLGSQELRRKQAMHAAAAIALLGLLACADGVYKTLKYSLGQTVFRPEAQIEKAITAVICAVFLALCVRSFREARARTGVEG